MPSFFVHIGISPPTPIDVAEDVKKWRDSQMDFTGSQLVYSHSGRLWSGTVTANDLHHPFLNSPHPLLIKSGKLLKLGGVASNLGALIIAPTIICIA